MAVAKAPTKLYFDVPLHSAYDVGKDQIRSMRSRRPPNATCTHSCRPPRAPPPTTIAVSALNDTPLAGPSAYIYGADPQEAWRKSITGNRTFKPRRWVPLPSIANSGCNLHARVYPSAGKLAKFRVSYECAEASHYVRQSARYRDPGPQ